MQPLRASRVYCCSSFHHTRRYMLVHSLVDLLRQMTRHTWAIAAIAVIMTTIIHTTTATANDRSLGIDIGTCLRLVSERTTSVMNDSL